MYRHLAVGPRNQQILQHTPAFSLSSEGPRSKVLNDPYHFSHNHQLILSSISNENLLEPPREYNVSCLELVRSRSRECACEPHSIEIGKSIPARTITLPRIQMGMFTDSSHIQQLWRYRVTFAGADSARTPAAHVCWPVAAVLISQRTRNMRYPCDTTYSSLLIRFVQGRMQDNNTSSGEYNTCGRADGAFRDLRWRDCGQSFNRPTADILRR